MRGADFGAGEKRASAKLAVADFVRAAGFFAALPLPAGDLRARAGFFSSVNGLNLAAAARPDWRKPSIGGFSTAGAAHCHGIDGIVAESSGSSVPIE